MKELRFLIQGIGDFCFFLNMVPAVS
jgi:hypothetical protein